MKDPWFRLYSDQILHERELTLIARATKRPKATLIGTWVILLSLANDSPIPGVLLATEDVPLALDDLRAEMGLDPKTVGVIIEQLIEHGLLSFEAGRYSITNWSRRVYKSDNSAERTREHRARMKDKNVTSQERHGDVTTDTTQGPPTFPPPIGGEKSEGEGSLESRVSVPSSFDDWLRAIADPKSLEEVNNVAVLVRMGQHLYTNFPADGSIYPRVGKLARVAGSASKLARILWDNASKPLAIPLDYLTAVVYARDEESGPEPRERTYYHTERLGKQ